MATQKRAAVEQGDEADKVRDGKATRSLQLISSVMRALAGYCLVTFTLGLLIVLAPPASPQAASVATLIAKHLEACGGASRLKAVTASRQSGIVTFTDGVRSATGRIVLEEKRPNKSRLERTMSDGSRSVLAYDGVTAWTIRPGSVHPRVLTAAEAADRVDSHFDSPFLDHSARGITIQVLGLKSVDNTPVHKVKVTFKSGRIRYSYLSTVTHLEVQRDYVETGANITRQSFGGHRSFQGLVRPTIYRTWTPGEPGSMTVTVESFEANPTISDDRFTFPR